MDQEQRNRFARHAAAIIVNIVAYATLVYGTPQFDRIPYHTSALTGAAWVAELMNGHPERIRCELGVHLHVFRILVAYLQVIGNTHSRAVYLEEQLAIFLYRCTTGLSIRHVGEHFQRSNETISKYVFQQCRLVHLLLLAHILHQIFFEDAVYLLVAPLLH
jgi:hypothetical protein